MDIELAVDGSSNSKAVNNAINSFDKSLVQLNRESVPACTSVECKTASATTGFDVPTVAPELYGPG